MAFKIPFKNKRLVLLGRIGQLLHQLPQDGVESEKDASMKAIIHELQVHQLELEIQNEELRETQLKLSNTRDQYRQLYDYAPVAYLTLSREGEILEANLKASELLGESRKHLIGKSLSSFIANTSQDEWYLHRQAVFSDESKQIAKLQLRPGTAAVVVSIESSATTSISTSEMLCHSVLIDTTRQHQAEEELKSLNRELEGLVEERTFQIEENYSQLKAVLDTAIDAILTINDQGVIETVNPATGEMFGYSEGELVKHKISKIMPEPRASSYSRYLMALYDTSDTGINPGISDLFAKRKDGSLFPISLSVNRIGQENRYTFFIRDISERIELEREILQKVEEERDNISHELHDTLGQSLAAIALKTRNLALEVEESGSSITSGLVKSELVKIGDELQLVGREVRNIVANMMTLKLDEHELFEAFQWLIESCETYSKADIILEWSGKVEIADKRAAAQFFRIAQEALHNAIKHAQATRISVEVRQISDYIFLSVKDNGKGILSADIRQSHPIGGKGLDIMKYRAHVIGANFEIKPIENGGTGVFCMLPKYRHYTGKRP